jgi:Tfp pilus assembly protein PilE
MRVRRGFSFAELLVTMIFIGLLARLAVPRYSEMKVRATAASIMSDVHTIRLAAFTHYTEFGAFPPDAAAGTLPAQLVAGLPTGFSFVRPSHEYDWQVWTVANGSDVETLVGIMVSVTDPRLIPRLVLIAGAGYIPIVTPTQITFLVSRAS